MQYNCQELTVYPHLLKNDNLYYRNQIKSDERHLNILDKTVNA